MLPKLSATKAQLYCFLAFIVVLRIYTLVLFPSSGTDGPMYLSHAFSVLNGRFFRNDFLQEYIAVFNFPYLYGFLNAPFYLPFRGTFFQSYSLLIWSTMWWLVFLYGAYLLLRKQMAGFKKFTLFAAAYIVNIYTNSTRSEMFILPFFVLLLYVCGKAFNENKKVGKWVAGPLLIAVIGLMHPVAGVFACVLSFVYALENRVPWLTIIIFFSIVLLLVAAFYVPVILINYSAWQQNFLEIGFVRRTHSLSDFAPLFKYLFYSPAVLVLAVVILLSAKSVLRELLVWILPVFALCYFHQSYYYHYALVLLLWRLGKMESLSQPRWLRFLFYGTVVYGFVFGFIWPVIQYLENPVYTRTYKNTLAYLYDNEHNDSTKKVWVPADVSMPIIDQSNTRLHWVFILDYRDRMHKIDSSSIFYVTMQSQFEYIKQYPFVPGALLKVTTILKPCKGLITLSQHLDRSEPIGLWKVEVVNQ